MVYVALLRAINLGSKNKINMVELKQSLIDLELEQVSTYINTGNIIFSHDSLTKEELTVAIANMIEQQFGLSIKVLVLNIDELRAMLSYLPDTWVHNSSVTTEILFLLDEADQPRLTKKLSFKDNIDTVIVQPGVIFWSFPRDTRAQSGISKLAASTHYQLVTIRNANTVRHILSLMEQLV